MSYSSKSHRGEWKNKFFVINDGQGVAAGNWWLEESNLKMLEYPNPASGSTALDGSSSMDWMAALGREIWEIRPQPVELFWDFTGHSMISLPEIILLWLKPGIVSGRKAKFGILSVTKRIPQQRFHTLENPFHFWMGEIFWKRHIYLWSESLPSLTCSRVCWSLLSSSCKEREREKSLFLWEAPGDSLSAQDKPSFKSTPRKKVPQVPPMRF